MLLRQLLLHTDRFEAQKSQETQAQFGAQIEDRVQSKGMHVIKVENQSIMGTKGRD